MNPAKPANLPEVERLMADWSLLQRVRFTAVLMLEVLHATVPLEQFEIEPQAFDDIQMGEFGRAIQRCDGNWEPPDPPGWEGGFADNH